MAEAMLNKQEDAAESTLFRAQFQKTVICKFHQAGRCRNGNRCGFAHNPEELRQAPDLTKTSLCEVFMKGGKCKNSADCPFAHGHRELRKTPMFQAKLMPKRAKGQSGLDCAPSELAFGSPDSDIAPALSQYGSSALPLGLQDSSKTTTPVQECSKTTMRACLDKVMQKETRKQKLSLAGTTSQGPQEWVIGLKGGFGRQVSDASTTSQGNQSWVIGLKDGFERQCSDASTAASPYPVSKGDSDPECMYPSEMSLDALSDDMESSDSLNEMVSYDDTSLVKAAFIPVFFKVPVFQEVTCTNAAPCDHDAMKELEALLSSAMPDHYED